jgi:phage-related protein
VTAPTQWAATTAYVVGDIVRPTYDNDTGFFFRCTVAGTTGANEPFWPTVIANTVQDGTVTWMAVSIIAGDLQTPSPDAIIEMFELELVTSIHGNNDIYYFHAGVNEVNNGNIIWRTQAYQAFPIEADGFEYNGQGQLPRPKIRVSNILGTITALLLTLPAGLEGAKVTRVRTLRKYLDSGNFDSTDVLLTEDGFSLLYEDGTEIYLEPVNPTADDTAEFPREIYYIDRKTAENRDVVEFELVSSMDLAGVRAPKRQCISNICQWVYRSTECSYTGTNYFDSNDQPVGAVAQDVCGKRLSSCKARFGANNELPFGSFPGIGSSYG